MRSRRSRPSTARCRSCPCRKDGSNAGPTTTTRHDTSTLFAALDIATGQVTAALKPRHRHQEFLAFLRQIERTNRHVVDQDGEPVELHLVMDNYAAHKDANVRAWLVEHPRIVVHVTPTHA
jgi:hypothetical protein